MVTEKDSPNRLLYASVSLSLGIHCLLIGALTFICDFSLGNKNLSCIKVTLTDLPKPERGVCLETPIRTKPPGAMKSRKEAIVNHPGQKIPRPDKKPTEYPRPPIRERVELSSPGADSLPPPLPALPFQPQKEISTEDIPSSNSSGSSREGGDLRAFANDMDSGGFGIAGEAGAGEERNWPGGGDAENAYLAMVRQLIDKHQSYPHLARIRQIQGNVIIHFVITLEGTVNAMEIIKSSGYMVLDEAGIKAIKDASPFPKPPERFFKKEISIEVPIIFELT